MKNLEDLKARMPEFAKDVRANLENFLGRKHKLLTPKQTFGAALAAAYATKDKSLIKVMENEAKNHLSADGLNAAKIAAVTMAMNNSYYCFTHLSDDKEYLEMPIGLVMRNAKTHGIDKTDFEIFSLAVSVINSCGMCIDSHESQLFNAGFHRESIQMVVQIAAVMSSVAQALAIQGE